MSLSDVLSLFISRSFLEILCVRLTISHPQSTKIKASPIFLASKRKKEQSYFTKKCNFCLVTNYKKNKPIENPFCWKIKNFNFQCKEKDEKSDEEVIFFSLKRITTYTKKYTSSFIQSSSHLSDKLYLVIESCVMHLIGHNQNKCVAYKHNLISSFSLAFT